MKLTDRKWKSFDAFGENGLFDIHTTSSGIDKNKLVSDNNDNNTAPYVTRSGGANGVAGFVDPKNYKYGFDPANVITIGLDTQTAFYQPHKFITGQNIHVITGEKLTPLVIQFLLPLFRTQMVAKFNWGGNGATLSRMKRLRLMLPVNDKGQPDYDFMSDYEQELLEKKKNYYLKYVHSVLAKLEYVKIQPLSNLQWRTFRIDDLFESVTRPPARSKNKYDEGDIPFIASGASLNGSVKFCRPHENEVPDASNCITVSPVDGSSFYQSTEFLGRGGGGSSIIMLRSQRLNKYNGIFMARAINNTTSKYQYGHMATSDGIKRDRVLLPIDAQGQPDYDYMEQYVKNKMIQKYNHYLKYLNESVIGSNKL